MEVKTGLQFDLLGAFALWKVRDGQIRESVVPDKLGKKALSFLQYLIVNHGRNISSEELMEQFWPEADSSNPANSLKNMMFKTRSLLKGYGSGIGKFDSNPSGLLFLESLCGSGGRFGAL
ncbi:MAG: hypothetical protein HFI31_05405 [Lachnospiraceae bacterium]|jgi:DNA-binding SARP family transcriptional activator|nr:hypothetical protein [Lachnospiraceae bacterium]MCI8995880.1 hypothetical protein [Lachnospiraceae bacterium]MCI9133609.1 hypothetical protein [Lachnospiraceae bacterium]